MLSWASASIFALVSAVAFLMAAKGLTAVRLLPFHEQAGGRAWADQPVREQALALALTRSLGLGFLIAGLALAGAAVAVVWGEPTLASALGVLAAAFCAGLAAINHRLQRSTGAHTPWRGSLYAAAAILVAVALSWWASAGAPSR